MAAEAEDAQRYFEMAGDALTYAIRSQFKPDTPAQEVVEFLIFLAGRVLATLRDNGVNDEAAIEHIVGIANCIVTPDRSTVVSKGGAA